MPFSPVRTVCYSPEPSMGPQHATILRRPEFLTYEVIYTGKIGPRRVVTAQGRRSIAVFGQTAARQGLSRSPVRRTYVWFDRPLFEDGRFDLSRRDELQQRRHPVVGLPDGPFDRRYDLARLADPLPVPAERLRERRVVAGDVGAAVLFRRDGHDGQLDRHAR